MSDRTEDILVELLNEVTREGGHTAWEFDLLAAIEHHRQSQDLLSLNESSVVIGLNKTWLCRLAEAGRLPAKLVGKTWVVRRADLLEFGERHKAHKKEDKVEE